MKPLAKLWTWTGHSFIPIAVGWAVYVRGGLNGETASLGVLVSRGYWGLLLTLGAANILAWTFALYMRAAKRIGMRLVVPPNTTFESSDSRSRLISWGTAVVYAATIMAALVIFGVRYSESRIYVWNDMSPLNVGFMSSRLTAHSRACSHQPCFAVGPRFNDAGKPLSGVNEYVQYFTDGLLLVSAAALLLGLGYMVIIGMEVGRDRVSPRSDDLPMT
ncbi:MULTISPECIES: hypothetical protein [unclassified Mesorhizobium]|uniref:hypothetical protein n=1 Tax=unclassified Mesorhizobium TaxID=325217 RepID=UPI0033374EEC